jgi:hypothetical protein
MKKLDAATLGKLAPGLALVLLAGPVFLFLAGDLILFFAVVAPRTGYKPEELSTLAAEVVFCGFAGLLATYGIRMIRRRLKEAA